MATIGNLTIVLNAQTGPLAAGLKRAQADVGGFLKNVKGQLGEESALGGAFKALKGAGAVAGLALASNALRDATGRAVELRDALNSGAMSAGEVADQMARALPVVGGIYAAGRNIRELLTGEQAAVEAIRKEAELTNQIIDARRSIMKTANAGQAEMLKLTQQLRRETALLNEPDAAKREELQQQFDAADMRGNIDKTAAAQLKALEARKAQVRKLQEEIGARAMAPQPGGFEMGARAAIGGAGTLSGAPVDISKKQKELDQLRTIILQEEQRIEAARQAAHRAAIVKQFAADGAAARDFADQQAKEAARLAEQHAKEVAARQAEAQRAADAEAAERAKEAMASRQAAARGAFDFVAGMFGKDEPGKFDKPPALEAMERRFAFKVNEGIGANADPQTAEQKKTNGKLDGVKLVLGDIARKFASGAAQVVGIR